LKSDIGNTGFPADNATRNTTHA